MEDGNQYRNENVVTPGNADVGRRERSLMSRDSRPTIDRRTFLRLGSVTLATAVSGCQWGDDPTTESPAPGSDPAAPTDQPSTGETESAGRHVDDQAIPYSEQFETVVNVVRDAGADANAESSIVPILEQEADDDTLLYFPAGRYFMDDSWSYPSFSNLGIVGDGAVIVPKDGYDNYLFTLGYANRNASNLIFEGFTFDFRAAGTNPRPIQVQVADSFVVQDVRARGSSGTVRFDVTNEKGVGVVRRLKLPDGGSSPNPTGALVSPDNVGKLTFKDCHIQGFPDNGLYASPSEGPVHVIGGYYANSAISNVRVSGPAVVRDVHVECNRATEGFRNMRGIRLRHGEPVLVENCTVEMHDVTYSEGAIVVEPMMESPTIRDVDIDVSVDGLLAINAKSPEDSVEKPEIDCENVTITGTAGDGSTIRVVDRDGCTFDTLDIEQTGTGRDGLYLIRSHDANLTDVRFDVPGYAVVLNQSNFDLENTTIEQADVLHERSAPE